MFAGKTWDEWIAQYAKVISIRSTASAIPSAFRIQG